MRLKRAADRPVIEFGLTWIMPRPASQEQLQRAWRDHLWQPWFGWRGGCAAFCPAVKINGELANMARLAKQAQISTDKIQEIKFAANSEGVSDDDFNTSLQTSLQMLEEAQHQVNDLRRLFNANGKSIRDSNGDLIKFDQLLATAADLMSRAPTEQAKVKITEMMGFSRDWVRVLEGGPAAFQANAARSATRGRSH